jgi:hypothetical protein
LNDEATSPSTQSRGSHKYLIILGLAVLLGLIAILISANRGLEPLELPIALSGEEQSLPTRAEPAATATTAPPSTVAAGTAVAAAANATPKPTRTMVPLVVEPEPQETPTYTYPDGPRPEGALVAVELRSQVGVLLDELPAEMRDRVTEALLERPDEFWIGLATRQTRLTMRRLDFRNFRYDNRGQLPLPPPELWSFALDEAGPSRRTVQGHDLVLIDYVLTSTLLTDAASLVEAEPALAAEGGRWEEPFILPLDPDLLLQRTGNACVNEAGFPPNSFDSENAWVFYDHSCEAASGGFLGCHRTQLAPLSCVQALNDRIGTVETQVSFERLEWDDELADSARIGDVTSADQPDLKVIGEDLENYRVIYRYFPADSCALVEQCVSGSGWRRLLQFDATLHNIGGEALDVGPVVAEDPSRNLFQYNACHNHFHYDGYGDFILEAGEEGLSSKQAFCVESTTRFSNNEWSPLTHGYSCRVQGIQAGWVDEYPAGLDCQWIDITDVAIGEDTGEVMLGFLANPDRFLCEGTPLRDSAGNLLWEPSGLTGPNGLPIERPMCEVVPDWDANNLDAREIALGPDGSFVTAACGDDVLGPLRNCGFTAQSSSDPVSCSPGETVQLACSAPGSAAPQTLRICEYSEVLGTGVACVYEDALANVMVADRTTVEFVCPSPRDEAEPGGNYVLYEAPVFADDDAAPITCRPVAN